MAIKIVGQLTILDGHEGKVKPGTHTVQFDPKVKFKDPPTVHISLAGFNGRIRSKPIGGSNDMMGQLSAVINLGSVDSKGFSMSV